MYLYVPCAAIPRARPHCKRAAAETPPSSQQPPREHPLASVHFAGAPYSVSLRGWPFGHNRFACAYKQKLFFVLAPPLCKFPITCRGLTNQLYNLNIPCEWQLAASPCTKTSHLPLSCVYSMGATSHIRTRTCFAVYTSSGAPRNGCR